MNSQILDEDLQIVRATLATITEDVHRLSPAAGQALDEARAKLDQAHAEFVRPSQSSPAAEGAPKPDGQRSRRTG